MVRRWLFVAIISLSGAFSARAQLGDMSGLASGMTGGGSSGGGGGFGDVPVEITADGNTRVEGGVAIAEDNVQIHYKDYSIYCDYAEYNPETRDVLLIGNIRLYTQKEVLTGERALFNLETKQMRALEFNGSHYPMLFHAFSLRAPSMSEINVRDATMTTDDNSMPGFHVRARTIRIHTKDWIVFVNSTAYIGNVPILWLPFLFANINNPGLELLPGYDSRWGVYLKTAYSFPIGSGDALLAKVHLDLRSKLGVGVGGDLDMKYGKDNRSYGQLLSYYAFDSNPTKTGGPGEPNEDTKNGRYRVSFKQRLFLTDDIYATADINLLSDIDFLQDYFPNEYRIDPQPDNYLSVTKWNEFYTLNLIGRFQVNNFQDTTERLPELVLDIKQHRFFGLPVYYDGQTSVGEYKRAFGTGPDFQNFNFPDYESGRFDTFHQLSFPTQAFGWLNIIPKAGFRVTAYNKSGSFQDVADAEVTEVDPVSGEIQTVNNTGIKSSALNAPTTDLKNGGAIVRPIINLGLEVSAKISRSYEQVQSRFLGLDGLRHVMQPYINYSMVYNFGPPPHDVLQFDRVVPSTQLLPLDFPQFTAIDSIDTWNIMRVGIRNRLETRRDSDTYQWLTLDTFFDINFDNPYSDTDVSNIFNVLRLRPVPWFNINIDSQVPVVSGGFYEINPGFSFMPTRDLTFTIRDRYLEGNPYFSNNNQINFQAYYRVNDNWGLSMYQQYETFSQVWQYQRYMVHRDLSDWIVSLGVQRRANSGGDDAWGVVFALSNKDVPQATLPIQQDLGQNPIEPGNGNGL